MPDIAKHTPGPWNQQDNEILAESGAVICTVMFSDDFPCIDGEDEQDEADKRAAVDLECAANAQLLAAAPGMLDALRRIVSPAPGVSQKAPAWVYGIAKAAIAKAEGRTDA